MILVTGGTGLLGSYLLLELLKNNENVKATKRQSSNTENVKRFFSCYSDRAEQLFSRIEWVNTALSDTDELISCMSDVKKVYHCAGFVSFNPADRSKVLKTNITGTANVVNACLETGVKKLCYVSSVAALNNVKGKKQIDETDFRYEYSKKQSGYATSKYFAELEVWRGISEGLDAVIVNPSVILGAAADWQKSSANFFPAVANGLGFYTTGITGFIDARDVARSMIQLMESGISGERFVLSAENISYKTLFSWISHYLNKKTSWRKASPVMTEVAWRFEKLKSLLLGSEPKITSETAKAAFSQTCFSNDKIKEALNTEFIPIKECIEHISRIYKEHA